MVLGVCCLHEEASHYGTEDKQCNVRGCICRKWVAPKVKEINDVIEEPVKRKPGRPRKEIL